MWFIHRYQPICTGAQITTDDLKGYSVQIYQALDVPLRSGHIIYTLQPPSSGAILAFMLRVLEGQSNISYTVRENCSLIICPIAIAYSLGQIIKSVCVCLSVCPSASTLTVAFLDRFSPKLAQT